MTLAKAARDDAGSSRVAVLDRDLLPWLVVLSACAIAFALRGDLPWLKALPADLLPPISDWINVVMTAFVDSFKWLFRAVNWVLDWPMWWLQALLHWLPWPAAICLVAMVAYAASGAGLATFSVIALLYMVVIGYWDETMATLSLVGVSVPLSLLLGFAIGILGFKSRRAARIILPVLDLMQTMPTFAYLIPILLLFGFGQVVGLIASMIYAAPCMTRNVMLGLQRVPQDVLEAGQVMGCTRRQLLCACRSTALPTLMVGVNQTIVAQHGHHRRGHRRLQRHRLGAPEHVAQGAVRPEPALRHRHRADRHGARPHQQRLRPTAIHVPPATGLDMATLSATVDRARPGRSVGPARAVVSGPAHLSR
jgi:glycine betaine/proline transport system permease protein